jgi:integrase
MTSRRDHGDGGIDQRGPDRWRLRWRVAGRRHTKTIEGTKRAGQAELRRLLKSADDGTHVAPDRITLAAWVELWMTLLERAGADAGVRGRGLVNARTLERYASMMRVHVLPALGNRPLQQITPSELDALYRKLEERLAPATVHFVHGMLSGCFGTAMRKGLLVANPVSRADPPRYDGQVGQVLEQDQLSALLAGFRRYTLYPLVATAAFTGARRNELLALRWSDVNLREKTLTITRALELTKRHGVAFKEPKTARGVRTIAIDDNLVALLGGERDRHLRLMAGVPDGEDVDLSLVKLAEDALVFPSGIDLTRPRHPASVTGEFVKRARALGFPKLRFHDLRGTHETLLLDAGVPIHVVAARCGHDPAVLLRVYAKRTRKADKSAAAIIGALSTNILGG